MTELDTNTLGLGLAICTTMIAEPLVFMVGINTFTQTVCHTLVVIYG